MAREQPIPHGGSRRTEPDLHRHPYTNEAKELVVPKFQKLKHGQLTPNGPNFKNLLHPPVFCLSQTAALSV